jgi:hypothetical protein
MPTIQKVALAIVGVALATTLVLPDRKTPDVAKAAGGALATVLTAAEGRSK